MEKIDALQNKNEEQISALRTIIKRSALHALFLAASFILAYSGAFSGISPFGLAFTAAVPFPYCVSAATGACAGYALSADGAASILRFAAAVLAAALLRVLAECFIKSDIHRALYPAGAAVSAIATGIAVLSVDGFNIPALLSLFSESALAGGACFLFAEALPLDSIKAVETKSAARVWFETVCEEPRGRLALIFSLAIFISALTSYQIAGFKISVSIAVFLILLSAYISGAEGGSIAGVAFSTVLLLRGESVALALMLCLGGTLAGALSPLGRVLSAGIFCATCGFIALLNPVGATVNFLVLCIAGAAVFLSVSQKALAETRSVVQQVPIPRPEGQALQLLDETSLALKQVRECVERVSLSLEDLSAKHALDAAVFGDEIQTRTRTLREAVAEQLGGMEDILHDLSSTLARSEKQLKTQSAQAKSVAIRSGLACLLADCRLNCQGHIELNLTLADAPCTDFDSAAFLRKLEVAAGVELREISLENNGDSYRWNFVQKATASLDIGVAQRARGDAKLCGDYYSQFSLPSGETVFLLSDGMGTGGRAAVDSALTCTLFSTLAQSGLSFPCALRLTNSALMAKSAEESLATLDAAVFNPYTAELCIYKAGAAASFLANGRKLIKLESGSLPAGILRDIAFSEHRLKLKKGDICLLFSDGAAIEDESCMEKLLNAWSKGAEKLAQNTLTLALRAVPLEEQDDATVAVLIVE